MKNKRADIPVVVLVIGVFAICTLTLFSLNDFKLNFAEKESFMSVGLTEELSSKVNDYYFYKDRLGLAESEIAIILNIGPPDAKGRFIFVEKEKDFKYYLP